MQPRKPRRCGQQHPRHPAVRTMRNASAYLVGMLVLSLASLVVSCGDAPAKDDTAAAPAAPATETTAPATGSSPTTQTPAPAPATAPATRATPAPPPASAPAATATPAPTTPTPTVPPSARMPAKIPHTLEGRDNCLMCHRTGVGKAPAVPASHAERTIDMCRTCHQPR